MRAADPPALNVAERRRLARLLGMVGSSHDGEALNAARLADRMVRDAGLTWHEVLADHDSATPPPRQEPQINVLVDWPVRWQAAARLVAEEGKGLLREKDLAFARTVAGYEHRPTEKQLGYLHDLVRRVLEAWP